jgi:hypothetical protein
MPICLARAAGPPTTLMACCSAVSLFLRTAEIKQCFSTKVKHCLRAATPSDNQAMLDAKEIGRRITKAMDEAEVAGAALAEACGVTPQAISGWRSTGRFHKKHLPTIATLTGKPMEYFVSEAVPEKKTNGAVRPWVVEKVVDEDQFLIVFRTWQDARATDRQNLVAIAKAARKAHGTRRRRTG